MSLSSHFFFLTNRKCYFFQVDKSTIQVVEWQLKITFCLLKIPKFDFGEVETTMFQVFDWRWELVSFLLTSRKCELGEIEKAIFQGAHGTLNSFSAS